MEVNGVAASSEAGCLRVGSRIEILWGPPWRWEAGTVVEAIRQLARPRASGS